MRIEPADIQPAIKLSPAQRVADNHRQEMSNDLLVGQDEANALHSIHAEDFVLPSKILSPESLTPKKPTCILCEYVLHQIVEDLHNTSVVEEIETVTSRNHFIIM